MPEPSVNPYQSPATDFAIRVESDGEEGKTRPSYKLYSVGSIVLGAFLGSPIAGGVLMAINYRRVGRFTAAVHAVVWTTVFTVAIVAGGMVLPDDVRIPNTSFVVPQIIAMYFLAKGLQGSAIDGHQRRGGSLASAWGAAGVGIITAVIVLVAVFGVLLLSLV